MPLNRFSIRIDSEMLNKLQVVADCKERSSMECITCD